MSRPRILVVEDDNLVALDICQSLRELGYEVDNPVNSGELALERAQHTRPDVVLMDIRLAGAADGITAAAQISDSTDIPIIFLTAHADRATLERAKIVEPFAYILKPFEDIELNAAIQMVLYKTQRNRIETPGIDAVLTELTRRSNLNKVDRIKGLLRAINFFTELDDISLSQIAHASSEISLREGEVLPAEELGNASAFLVISGRVAMVQTATSGKELIVELVGPGDLFGLLAAIDKLPSGVVPIANRTSKILLIPRKSFVLCLEANPRLALRFTEFTVSRLRILQSLAKSIAYDDVHTRIASVIWALLVRNEVRAVSTGSRIPGGSSRILDITRAELSKLSGTRVETVVRVLKAMEKKGIVSLGQRKRLEVCNPNKLRELLPEADQANEPRQLQSAFPDLLPN